MTTGIIRYAQPKDIPEIIALCAAHADYEKAAYDSTDKLKRLAQHLFQDAATVKCLVVEQEGILVGYATFMPQFSTWDACFYIYLDCLYLDGSTRGQGIGQQLMERIKTYAQSQNCSEIQWQTPDFNASAIRFYKRLGAVAKCKERFFWVV